MKYILTAIALTLCSLSATKVAAQVSSIIAPGATLEVLGEGYKFTEGPAADAQGNVYFTDQPNDRIMRWDAASGKITEFMKPAGRANGMFFDRSGKLIACADDKTELWSVDVATGKAAVLAGTFEDKKFNGPNDCWVRPDNGIYFTDPFYKRGWWNYTDMPQAGQYVYYMSPDRKTTVRVAEDLMQPNGIIGTPDGKVLYVADIKGKKTYAYDIENSGKLANKRLFCEMGSDGMTIDTEGNVYLTGNGVTVFDKTGKQIEKISVPERWTANITFGGKDRKLLFITASTKVFGLKMKVAGVQ